MKSIIKYQIIFCAAMTLISCTVNDKLYIQLIETSASGRQLSNVDIPDIDQSESAITLIPSEKYQTITGIGGAFTESSAYLLNQLSLANRKKILEAYFGENGAQYSLTRTHINSCDFSLKPYSYAPVEEDQNLEYFSIEEDLDDLIPMIKDAMSISKEGFKIIASPWTAPPWMKDNKDWKGGALLPEYYDSWALFFSKYIKAYQEQGIPIWGITVENEPLGNGNNWESMHFTPEQMNDFVIHHLHPQLKKDGHEVKILGYDQNRGKEMKEWVDMLYKDERSSAHFDGVAVHWYASTFDFFPEALQLALAAAPEKHLIQTEGCIDAEVPVWQDDQWYWSEEATDWGYDWAPEEDKYLHPKYVPVHRYARDMIGCFNNWVDGWIDWNIVLDTKGGPNWAKNWCIAPVIVDPANDEVYFTPIYYVMAHFSKYIRPGAVIIGHEKSDDDLMTVAAQNTDGSFVVIVFNEGSVPKNYSLTIDHQSVNLPIDSQTIQTIIIPSKP